MRCHRCKRRWNGQDETWNCTAVAGRIVALTCGTCQTAEENAEAEINLATLEYDTDAFGRAVARPRSS